MSTTFSLSKKKPDGVYYPASQRDRKMQVGDQIDIILGDGTRHPELAGRRGHVTLIQANGTLVIEVENGGGTYKSGQLWWQRSKHWTDG